MYLHFNYILLTLGNSPIGTELVQQLYDLKNQLILVSKDKEYLQQMKKKFPQVYIVECDLQKSEDLSDLVQQCKTLFPFIEMVIHHDLEATDLQKNQLTEAVCQKTQLNHKLTCELLPILQNNSEGTIIVTKIIPVSRYSESQSGAEKRANLCSLQSFGALVEGTKIALYHLPVKLRETNTESAKSEVYAKKLVEKFIDDLFECRLENQNVPNTSEKKSFLGLLRKKLRFTI